MSVGKSFVKQFLLFIWSIVVKVGSCPVCHLSWLARRDARWHATVIVFVASRNRFVTLQETAAMVVCIMRSLHAVAHILQRLVKICKVVAVVRDRTNVVDNH